VSVTKTETLLPLDPIVFTPTTFRHTKRLPIRISRPSHKKFHFKIRPKGPHEQSEIQHTPNAHEGQRPIIESYFSSDIEDIVDVDELDRYKQNLIVVDNFVTEEDQKKLIDLAIRGRKMNASMIYITQDWYRVPKSIRLQCNYLSIFPSCDGNDISLVFREKGLDKKLRKYYENNIKNFDCLTIDFKTPEMKYRKNFTPINDI
jgi:hypothetical protein